MSTPTLIGPIHQLPDMSRLPLRGAIKDQDLPVLNNVGIYIKDGSIKAVDDYQTLLSKTQNQNVAHEPLKDKFVALPGFIDAHTHICFSGSRAKDYALRNAGKTYLEIAESGGGIWSTVIETRKASAETLTASVVERADYLLKQGITTIEVKTGYGLSIDEEIKMLKAIKTANEKTNADLIATCLAAHTFPKDFSRSKEDYLKDISEKLLPLLKKEYNCNRVDAFIEKSAFNESELLPYFSKAKSLELDITIHADQFTTGGSIAAINTGAISADHLEASTDAEINMLSKSKVIPIVLPGASLGLGMPFAPARKILDAGCSLVIASDFNPGSAPMGQLLMQAAVLGAYQKLSNAEVIAAITYRAAKALSLNNRGLIQEGMLADIILFKTDDYKEITYQQGRMQPEQVWKNGKLIKF